MLNAALAAVVAVSLSDPFGIADRIGAWDEQVRCRAVDELRWLEEPQQRAWLSEQLLAAERASASDVRCLSAAIAGLQWQQRFAAGCAEALTRELLVAELLEPGVDLDSEAARTVGESLAMVPGATPEELLAAGCCAEPRIRRRAVLALAVVAARRGAPGIEADIVVAAAAADDPGLPSATLESASRWLRHQPLADMAYLILGEGLATCSPEQAVHVLGKLDRHHVVPRLAEAVHPWLDDADRRLRALAVRVLCAPGCERIDDVTQAALHDPDPGVRVEAVECLAEIDCEEGPDMLLPALLDALADPSRRVRRSAVEVLGRDEAPAAVAERACALLDAEGPEAVTAVMLLQELREYDVDDPPPPPEHLARLESAARSSREDVRREAAWALWRWGAEGSEGQTARVLAPLLIDPSPEVRLDAAHGLAILRSVAEIDLEPLRPWLEAALHDDVEDVRDVAGLWLREEGQAAGAPLR